MGSILYRHKDARQAGVLFNSHFREIGPDRSINTQDLPTYSQLGLDFDNSYDPISRVSGEYTVVYVAKDGNNTTGASWATALTSIDEALSRKDSEKSLVVCVKEGMYNVASVINTSDVYILGGYNGSNPTWQTREGFSHPTVISKEPGEDVVTLESYNVMYDGLVFKDIKNLHLKGGCSNCVFDNVQPWSGYALIYSTFDKLYNNIFVNLNIELSEKVSGMYDRDGYALYSGQLVATRHNPYGREYSIDKILICNSTLKGGDTTYFGYLKNFIVNNTSVRGTLASCLYDGIVYKSVLYSYLPEGTALYTVDVVSSTLYDARVYDQSVIKDSIINGGYLYNSYIYNCKLEPRMDECFKIYNTLLVNVTHNLNNGSKFTEIAEGFSTFVRCGGIRLLKRAHDCSVFMDCDTIRWTEDDDPLFAFVNLPENPYRIIVSKDENYKVGFVDLSDIDIIGYNAELVGLEETVYGDYRLQSWSSLLGAGKSITALQEAYRRQDVTGVERTAFSPSIGCYELAATGERIEKSYDLYKIDVYGNVVKLAEGLTPEKMAKIQQAQSKVAMLDDDFDPDAEYTAVSRRNTSGGQLALGSLWQRKDSTSDMVKISDEEWDFISDKYAIKDGNLCRVDDNGTLKSIADGASQVTESGANGDAYALIDGGVYKIASPEEGGELVERPAYEGNIAKLCNTQSSGERVGPPLVIDTDGNIHYKEYGDVIKDKVVKCLDGDGVVFVDAVGAGSVSASVPEGSESAPSLQAASESSSIYDGVGEDPGVVDEPILAVAITGDIYIGTLVSGVEKVTLDVPGEGNGTYMVKSCSSIRDAPEPLTLVPRPKRGVRLPKGVTYKDGKIIIYETNPPKTIKVKDILDYFEWAVKDGDGNYHTISASDVREVNGKYEIKPTDDGVLELEATVHINDKYGRYLWTVKLSLELEYSHEPRFPSGVTVSMEVRALNTRKEMYVHYKDFRYTLADLASMASQGIGIVIKVESATDPDDVELYNYNGFSPHMYWVFTASDWGEPNTYPMIRYNWPGDEYGTPGQSFEVDKYKHSLRLTTEMAGPPGTPYCSPVSFAAWPTWKTLYNYFYLRVPVLGVGAGSNSELAFHFTKDTEEQEWARLRRVQQIQDDENPRVVVYTSFRDWTTGYWVDQVFPIPVLDPNSEG